MIAGPIAWMCRMDGLQTDFVCTDGSSIAPKTMSQILQGAWKGVGRRCLQGTSQVRPVVLHWLAQQDILHNDIKPMNIFVDIVNTPNGEREWKGVVGDLDLTQHFLSTFSLLSLPVS